MCGGELGDEERGRDAWKALAYQMSLRWPAASHLPCTCPPGILHPPSFPSSLSPPSPVSFLQMSAHAPCLASLACPSNPPLPANTNVQPTDFFSSPRSVVSPARLSHRSSLDPDPPALTALTPKPPAAAAGQSPPARLPEAASRAPRTNPIRKSSCLLRAMNRPPRARRARRLRGLRSRTRTSSSPQLAPHGAGQPSQAMLGGGAAAAGRGAGAGRGVAKQPQGPGPAPCASRLGARWGRSGPALPLSSILTRPSPPAVWRTPRMPAGQRRPGPAPAGRPRAPSDLRGSLSTFAGILRRDLDLQPTLHATLTFPPAEELWEGSWNAPLSGKP